MKLSIIIPAYNSDKYLEHCVNSCLNQDISKEEYEILIINDGSTDNTPNIANSLAAEHDNIFIITQCNQGLSKARNNGIRNARGNYIWFVDSDDWISTNCLKEIISLCEKDNLDILQIGAEENGISMLTHKTTGVVIDGVSILKQKPNLFTACFNIFKKEFLHNNNLLFYPNVFHEDTEFIPKALYYAKRLRATNVLYYHVFSNQNSITRTVNPKKCYDCLLIAESLINFSNTVDRNISPYILNWAGNAVNASLKNARGTSFDNIRNLNNALYEKIHLIKALFHAKSRLLQIEGLIFLICGRRYYQAYNLLAKLKGIA